MNQSSSGPSSGPAVLVTGGGGFIGGAIAGALAAAGWPVRAGVRPGGRAAVPAGCAAVAVDVTDRQALAAAMAGCAGVVHAAVGDWRTTVEGTRAVLAAAGAAGVGRVVHLSSVAVYGPASGAVDEDTPLLPAATGGYAGAKVAAEDACRAAAAAGQAVVMLRPAIVTGPGSELWVASFARRLAAGQLGPLGPLGEGTCNPVHVADVAAAAVAALAAPPGTLPPAAAFNVSGAESLTWNAYIERLAAALGLPARPLSPRRVRTLGLLALPFKAAQRMAPPLRPILRPLAEAVPGPSERALFALRATYPTARAEALLGWRPARGLDATLAEAAAWWREHGR